MSTTGLIHFIVGALGFAFLAVSWFAAARALGRRGASSLARLSFFCGLAVVLGFFGGPALSAILPATLGIWFGVIAGWAWLVIVSLHLCREASDADRAAGLDPVDPGVPAGAR